MKFPHSGLYAITQTNNKTTEQLYAEVEAAIKGGASVIQYRDKPKPELERAQHLLALCHQYQIPLIINDDIQLARETGADGVHLGRDDNSVFEARRLLGSQAIIGVSCYNDLDKAIKMQSMNVDYVAFGRFFPSSSKPLASPAQLDTLRRAKSVLHVPVVAIGGILPDNGSQLLNAGADILAVIGGVFASEPESAARQYTALFTSES